TYVPRRRPPFSSYTTLFRSAVHLLELRDVEDDEFVAQPPEALGPARTARRNQQPIAHADTIRALRLLRIDSDPLEGTQSRMIRRSEEHTSELQSLAYLVCRL